MVGMTTFTLTVRESNATNFYQAQRSSAGRVLKDLCRTSSNAIHELYHAAELHYRRIVAALKANFSADGLEARLRHDAKGNLSSSEKLHLLELQIEAETPGFALVRPFHPCQFAQVCSNKINATWRNSTKLDQCYWLVLREKPDLTRGLQ